MKVPRTGTLLACLVMMCAIALPAPAQASMSDQEREVVKAINMLRATGGLPRLKRSPKLAEAATLHNSTMLRLDFFSHEWPDGTDPLQRVTRFFGDGRVGETLAYAPVSGDTSAVGVVKMWLNSPPHLKVLINRAYRRVGVSRETGTLFGKPVVIWTADFGAKY